jgi:hypothetical protein
MASFQPLDRNGLYDVRLPGPYGCSNREPGAARKTRPIGGRIGDAQRRDSCENGGVLGFLVFSNTNAFDKGHKDILARIERIHPELTELNRRMNALSIELESMKIADPSMFESATSFHSYHASIETNVVSAVED